MDYINRHKKLLALAGPSSREGGARELLKEMAAPYADELTVDTLGNLICHKKGKGKKIMVAAHMDVKGFVINHVGQDGMLYFQPIGEYRASAVIGCTVCLENGIYGVVGVLPQSQNRTLESIGYTDLYIDIGCCNGEAAAEAVPRGTYGVYTASVQAMEGNLICGPYGDNIAGCMAMLDAMAAIGVSDNDIYFVFTAMREPGPSGRGAMAAAYHIAPYAGISIDAAGTKDVPHLSGYRGSGIVGHGPYIKIKEDKYLCDKTVVEHIKEAALKAGIACQDEIWPLGATAINAVDLSDMVSMQNSRGGVFAGGIGIPVRYAGEVNQVYSVKDVGAAAKLLTEVLEKAF